MINQDRLIDTFLELVRIDSPSGQEAEIGSHLAVRLQALGFTTEFDEIGNLVGRLNGADGDWLLLSAHMDTVGTDIGIEPVIRDGVIYSAGDTILGGDDKSGVAAILEVLRTLQEEGLPHPPLEVVISVGEELGLYGARHLDTSKLRARQGVVLDSGGPAGHLVISAPGQDSLVFTVNGVSSHAGAEPERGINAIRVAAEAIAAMPMGRIDFETTSNIGIIEGGTARNIVPDRVRVVGEARSRDAKKLDSLTQSILDAFNEAAARHNTSVDCNVTRAYNAYRLSDETPIVQAAAAAARAQGHEVVLCNSGGGTDGNIYNAAGIACVVISTGMEDVHTPSEHIAIADMVAGTELLMEIVSRLATG
ncbi:MAG: M20/M25/M40 family metallo-hydrolase [Anaerolineae bacterium]|nr:M20/M25/M40 family metallo-hydrolase [Anaerolineae bacterium]